MKLEVVPRPFFVVDLLIFQVIVVISVRLGLLLQANFNLLRLEMLTKADYDLFWSSTNSELNFLQYQRNFLLKILDPHCYQLMFH